MYELSGFCKTIISDLLNDVRLLPSRVMNTCWPGSKVGVMLFPDTLYLWFHSFPICRIVFACPTSVIHILYWIYGRCIRAVL